MTFPSVLLKPTTVAASGKKTKIGKKWNKSETKPMFKCQCWMEEEKNEGKKFWNQMNTKQKFQIQKWTEVHFS